MKRRDLLRTICGWPVAGVLPRAWGLRAAGATVAALEASACHEPSLPPLEGELRGPDRSHGHHLREAFQAGLWASAPTSRVRVAIVGGGPAGLSAAWQLTRRGVEGVHLYELEKEVGGTSLGGHSAVSDYPWGAHYLPLPDRGNTALVELLGEMGALDGVDDVGNPIGAETRLVREPEERVFYRGYWHRGLYPYAGASERDMQELTRFRAELDRLASLRDGAGRPAFALPLSRTSDDAHLMELDRITATQWLEREGYRSERLRWLVDYACRDDYGLRASEASAWAALLYWGARIRSKGAETANLLAWPSGNAALVEHLRSRANVTIETGCMAAHIEQGESEVTISLLDTHAGRALKVVADRCIVAAPRFIARRIVAPLVERPDEGFRYGAWVVANLHLASRPGGRGFGPCWDNVLYDSPSLGYVEATHQRGRDVGPTVWTYYLPLAGVEPRKARERLEGTDLATWQSAILADLTRAHPDLRKHVRRIDVHRWAHAMVQPRPGFISSAARRGAREAIGRLHFAHSDLSGVALFEEAFDQGLRAANEVADRFETPG